MSAIHFPAWVNGQMFAPGEPALAADDQGFLLGLSVFDTLLYEGGCLLFRDVHLDRLASGAAALGISFGQGRDPKFALDEYIASFEDGAPDPMLVRITATRGYLDAGPSLVVTGRAVQCPPTDAVVLALASAPKAAGDPVEGIKSTNRLRNVLALEEARVRGAWEALFMTTDGQLSEGAISNFFLVFGDADEARVATPPLAHGCLAGTTRELVIEQLRKQGYSVEERPLSMADLATASEAFLTNTSQRALAVRQILDTAGNPIKTNLKPNGSVTQAALAAVLAAEADFRASVKQK